MRRFIRLRLKNRKFERAGLCGSSLPQTNSKPQFKRSTTRISVILKRWWHFGVVFLVGGGGGDFA